MPLALENESLQNNESLKSFETTDSLAQSYLDLHNKISAGDISILPEEIRKDPTIANFKNVNDVAKALVETKKMVGAIKKAPEKPDGYKFTALEGLHSGIKNVPETQKVLASIFHEAGLHNEAADLVQQKVLTLLSNGLQKQDEARKAKATEVETALRAEWKENYDKNLTTVQNVLKRAGAEELASSISGNPIALRTITKITSLLSEDSIGKLEDGNKGTVTDSKIARDRINQMIKEQWHLKKGAEYDKAKEEWDNLHKVAYGT